MENEKSEQKNRKKLKSRKLIIAGIVILLLIMLFFIIGSHIHHTINRLHCGTNLSLLSMAMLVYVNDSNQYPTPEKWCDLLIEKCKVEPKTFRCQDSKEGPCNYALNKYISEMGTTNDPDIVVLFETHPGWNQVGGPEILTTENHEGKGCNVVFLDGHVEFIKAEDISKLKWKPD